MARRIVVINKWFELNTQKKEYRDKIRPNKTIQPYNGHHGNHCISDKINNHNPICRGCNAVKKISKQSKIKLYNGKISGLCIAKKGGCWNNLCIKKKWDHQLSYRANEICDALNIDEKKRKNINQFNIAKILDLPCNSKFNHCSLTRREIGNKIQDYKEAIELEKNDKHHYVDKEDEDYVYVGENLDCI